MTVLAAWGTLQTVLVIIGVIIVIALIAARQRRVGKQ